MQSKNAPWHYGTPFANKCVNWLPSDSKENFEKACQQMEWYRHFAQQGWLSPEAITYKFNSHGFRCDEFDSQDCIVCLGCSYTIGIGLPLAATWPQLIANHLLIPSYTLAWGGNSADTCFRMAEYWIPQLKPKAVFMLTPPPDRFELIRASGSPPVDSILPLHITGNSSEFDNFFKHWFTMEENARLNQLKNKLAIKAMCHDFEIPCMIYDAFDHMTSVEHGYARDCMHAGPDAHESLAQRILDDYTQKFRNSTS